MSRIVAPLAVVHPPSENGIEIRSVSLVLRLQLDAMLSPNLRLHLRGDNAARPKPEKTAEAHVRVIETENTTEEAAVPFIYCFIYLQNSLKYKMWRDSNL